ncbi:MAG: hypothetical protein QOF51_187 [Chloroflexota bacterium]|jgi:hypothetical protein|nr:hypothetical protein [Chloroflexota bacterium]
MRMIRPACAFVAFAVASAAEEHVILSEAKDPWP